MQDVDKNDVDINILFNWGTPVVMKDAYDRNFDLVWILEDDLEFLEDVQMVPTLLDVLVVFILATSIVSISLLVLNIFKVHISIILSTIFTLSIFWVRNSIWKIDIDIKKNNHTLPILMLLLIGLLFRSEPYHYIAGGQDEGVYVNMSKYYEFIRNLDLAKYHKSEAINQVNQYIERLKIEKRIYSRVIR